MVDIVHRQLSKPTNDTGQLQVIQKEEHVRTAQLLQRWTGVLN